MVDIRIAQLVRHALQHGLIQSEDAIYARNRLLHILQRPGYREPAPEKMLAAPLEEILEALCEYAVESGLIADRDAEREIFETELMGALTPPPSQVIEAFRRRYAQSPQAATAYYYAFSQQTNYIRAHRTKLDKRWEYESDYGPLQLTINLAKPEKDPRDILAAQSMPQTGYPSCQLCVENEGYAGRVDHPARQNLRIIPLELGGEEWGLQYSPYVYYNEHCIVMRRQHVPMGVHPRVFRELLDFLALFPHYVIGSNAGLPVVGGSILSHDHFQGGRHVFPIALAPLEDCFVVKGYAEVELGIVRWPMAALRLTAMQPEPLQALAEHILACWVGYSDPTVQVFARTENIPHNAITPVARMQGERYELDLVLRNNYTTAEYPLGLFHPHPELHHIKKENIGLIEAMGLVILPARLKQEMALVREAVLEGRDLRQDPRTALHASWAEAWRGRPDCNADTIERIMQDEIGRVFEACLLDASVFKRDAQGKAALRRFIGACGGRQRV